MAKTTASFKTSVPKLKYLKPEPTTMLFTFEVDSADINPLFLQELSEKVRADYLVPLNDTWSDLWKKWDDDLDRMIPTLATKTDGARRKVIDTYVAPLDTEYQKQLGNIEKQAKTIGDRYWAEIARQRTELRDFRLKTAAKVVWKGIGLGTSVATIVSSGGTAVLSYVQALRKVYQIYEVMKTYTASADDYRLKVYKDIESLKTAIWKIEGSMKGFQKKQINAQQHLKDMEKYLSPARKELDRFRDNLKILDVKIGQFHLSAGDLSTQLDKALDGVDALSLDPKLQAEHRAKIMSLILDVQRMSKEAKGLQGFFKQAEAYGLRADKTLKEEESYLKLVKSAIKTGVKETLKETGEILTRISGDVVAQQAITKSTADLGGFVSGWQDKIATGMKIVDTVLKVF